MTDLVRCPRCVWIKDMYNLKLVTCELCDGKETVRPEIAAAYRLRTSELAKNTTFGLSGKKLDEIALEVRRCLGD